MGGVALGFVGAAYGEYCVIMGVGQKPLLKEY
jgi:hypothetical protein